MLLDLWIDVELLRHNVIIQRFTSIVIVMVSFHGWKASNVWTHKNDLFIYIFIVKTEIFGSRRLFRFETLARYWVVHIHYLVQTLEIRINNKNNDDKDSNFCSRCIGRFFFFFLMGPLLTICHLATCTVFCIFHYPKVIIL